MADFPDLDRLVALAAEVDESNSRLGIIRHEAMQCVLAIPTLVARVRSAEEELASNRACNLYTWKQRATEAEATAETLRAQLHGMQDGAALRDALAAKERAEAKVRELEGLVRTFTPQDRGLIGQVQEEAWQNLHQRAEQAEAKVRELEQAAKANVSREFVAYCQQRVEQAELRHEREARERERRETVEVLSWYPQLCAADALAEALNEFLTPGSMWYGTTTAPPLREALRAYEKARTL